MRDGRLSARGSAHVGHSCRVVVVLALLGTVASRPARACSPPNPAAVTPTAIPRDGSTDVPTATSFVILSGAPPVDVTLMAGDVAVPLTQPVAIGAGGDDATKLVPITFWQVKASGGFLPPSATLVLSASDGKGGRVVLTTVQTAAGYDKQQGTPANLKSLTLTRVRYPIAEINSGDCVFSEYIGYITFDADPATIPGTPPESVVSSISLTPKYGGAAPQGVTFTGAKPYSGDPPGAYSPTAATWMPFLDPTLEYCAGITSFGFGDIARLPLVSNTVCARVQEISMPGARVDAGATADAGGDADGGRGDSNNEGADLPTPSKGGCDVAGASSGPTSSRVAVAGSLLLIAAALRRRGRRALRT
jgi:hypothetical protein